MDALTSPPTRRNHLTRLQLLERWGLKATITLRRYEKAGKLTAMRLSPRVILYDLAEIERIEREAQA
jgi:hypothetical protein